MALQTGRDIPLFIRSNNASSERRITPSWNLAQLKTKLEPVTGIPPSCQSLTLKLPGQDEVAMEALDEEVVQVSHWSLQAYAEIYVSERKPFHWSEKQWHATSDIRRCSHGLFSSRVRSRHDRFIAMSLLLLPNVPTPLDGRFHSMNYSLLSVTCGVACGPLSTASPASGSFTRASSCTFVTPSPPQDRIAPCHLALF